MGELGPDILSVGVVIVAILSVGIYKFIVEKRAAKAMDRMLDSLETAPDDLLLGETGDVAIGWVESGEHFVYLNTFSDSIRKIEKDEIQAIDVQENGLLIRHLILTGERKTMSEELASAANSLLPENVSDKIERLEIIVKTKQGGPPMGYNIPVVEHSRSSESSDYKMLRDTVVETTNRWREVSGLS